MPMQTKDILKVSVNGKKFTEVQKQHLIGKVGNLTDEEKPPRVEIKTLTGTPVDFESFVENELYGFFCDAAEDDFTFARSSLLESLSDELFLGPHLVCGSFEKYQQMAKRVIHKYEQNRKHDRRRAR